METLDQDVVTLAKSIRQKETGGDFNVVGDHNASHKSYGAYQFGEDTWNNTAPRYGINVPIAKATPQQQNEVAYRQIKEWKDQGYRPDQIASMWNAGKGEPNAYTGKFSDGSPSSRPGKFDVPAYVKDIKQGYQTLKQGGQVSMNPNNPSSIAGAQQSAQQMQGPYAPGYQPPEQKTVGGFLGNAVSSFGGLLGGIASAVAHPVETVKTLGNIGTGAIEAGAEKAAGALGIPYASIRTPEREQFSAVADFYKNRYGSAQGFKDALYEDPAGVAADISVLFSAGAGAAGKLGSLSEAAKIAELSKLGVPQEVINAARGSSVASKASGLLGKAADLTNPLTLPVKAAGAAVKLPLMGAKASLGVGTGVGSEAISEGFQAARRGGDAAKAFKEALRGGGTPDDLIMQAKNALGQIVEERGITYRKMLDDIKADPSTYDVSPVLREMENGLKEYQIGRNADGSLDFSRSKIRFNKAAQADVQTIVDEMNGFGLKAGDRTAAGIDNLKQAFYELDKPSSTVRSFTTRVAKAARQVLDDTPGYTEAMKKYADMSDQIRQYERHLSLGDRALAETTFKKLTSSLKGNDYRAAVLKELDDATGGTLIPRIAGQRFSSIAPRGIVGAIGAGVMTPTAVIAGAGGVLPLLALAMTTSPRLVGEFLRALGIGARATDKLMELLGKVNPQVPVATGLLGQRTAEVQ